MTQNELQGIQESLDHIVKHMVTCEDVREIVDERLEEKFDEKLAPFKTEQIQMRQDITELQQDMKSVKTTVNNTFTKIDGFLKKMDTEKMERTALHHKVERHDGWIHDIARETNVALS